MSRSLLAGLTAIFLCACATPEAAPHPATILDQYQGLLLLSDDSFRCTPANRPSIDRMRSATSAMQDEIRAELVRREGENAVAEAERAYDDEVSGVYYLSGPICLDHAERAREQYRRALYAMQRRLGLPVGSTARHGR